PPPSLLAPRDRGEARRRGAPGRARELLQHARRAGLVPERPAPPAPERARRAGAPARPPRPAPAGRAAVPPALRHVIARGRPEHRMSVSAASPVRCGGALGAALGLVLIAAPARAVSEQAGSAFAASVGQRGGPGEPLPAPLAGGSRGVDVTVTGKLVPAPRTRRAVLLPGGAHDAADDSVGRPSGAGD